MKLDFAPLTRFLHHLPKNGDTELALLKCHLLIEEVLTKLIARSTTNPSYLSKARLSFSQKVWLARTLTALEHEPWLWEALRLLNEARNALAHGLDTGKIEERLSEFVRVVEAQNGSPDAALVSEPFGRVQIAAFHVFIVVSTHAHVDLSDLRIGTLLTTGISETTK